MDDAPRIGALQYLFVMFSVPFGIMFAEHVGDTDGTGVGEIALGALVWGGLTALCWGIVVWLELYARGRQREEEERRRAPSGATIPGVDLHGSVPLDGTVPLDEL